MSGMPGAFSIVPTLTDGVATLRAPTDDDIEGSYEQCQDPVSQQWTTIPVPYTRDDARTYLRHMIPGGWETDREWGFVVEARDETGAPRFAGTISLRNRGEGRAEIAYGSHPWVRGRGVIERALRLLLEWGFAERDLRTVVWLARRGNWPSRRLAWRLGFTFEGALRDWMPQRGELVDAWVATLRRGEEMAPRQPWLLTPRITGASVVLRPWTEADLPRVVEAVNDPDVQRYSQSIRERAPHDESTVRARHLELQEESARGSSITWAVADAGTDEFLGSLAVFSIHPGREAELGYWAHPAARRRGAMTQACRMAVRHVFIDAEDGGLGLHRLTAYAADENHGSLRVLERSGFTRFGVERRSTLLPDGSFVDTVAFDQLAGDHPRHGW
jgi:RimJ/RimL family protein N-acetyltransferase